MAAGYVAKILNPAKILPLLRQYPVYCGDHATDRLTTKTVLDPGNNPVQDVKPDGTAQDYLHLPKASRISWFDLRPETQQNGKPWLKLHLEFQETSAVHTSHGKAKRLRPAFYLPYKLNSMTRMKLSPPPAWAGSDVVFFATATINGCSVYIEGPADTPKVAHANASNFQSVTSSTLTWAQKQAKIQQKSAFMDQRFAPLKKTATATLAERRNYMAVSGGDIDAARTRYAGIMGVPVDSVYPDTYNPIGAVVGLKSNGAWRFLLQKSVSFGYRPRRGGYASGFVVLEARELWPGGAGHFRTV